MKRIESLTFLRFIAAFIVVVFHFGQNTTLARLASPFIVSGPQMVSLFFVLSGFVMMVAHYDKGDETFLNYYVKRFARIAPIYFVALFLSACSTYGVGVNNIRALFLNITFLQSWFPPYALSINAPAWSLSVEAFFYLTFPFILFAIKKSNISWKSFTIIALLFYFFTQAILSNLLTVKFDAGYTSTAHDLIYYFPLSHFCSFILGIAGGLIYSKHPEWFNKTSIVSFLILIVTALVNYFALQRPGIISHLLGMRLAFASSFYSLFFLFLILSLTYSRNFITNIMSTTFLVILGEASYSLYILQSPIHTIYTKYISTFLLGYLNVQSPNREFLVFSLLLICVSIASLYLIERPAQKIILNLYKRITVKSLVPAK
jgi:peptidoglycan/LPS O-acetylase OafA/YrhL